MLFKKKINIKFLNFDENTKENFLNDKICIAENIKKKKEHQFFYDFDKKKSLKKKINNILNLNFDFLFFLFIYILFIPPRIHIFC